MSYIVTALTSLMTLLRTGLAGIAGLWVIAVPATFFVLGLAVKFLYGLIQRGKKRGR